MRSRARPCRSPPAPPCLPLAGDALLGARRKGSRGSGILPRRPISLKALAAPAYVRPAPGFLARRYGDLNVRQLALQPAACGPLCAAAIISWRALGGIFPGGPGLFRRGMAEMPPCGRRPATPDHPAVLAGVFGDLPVRPAPLAVHCGQVLPRAIRALSLRARRLSSAAVVPGGKASPSGTPLFRPLPAYPEPPLSARGSTLAGKRLELFQAGC